MSSPRPSPRNNTNATRRSTRRGSETHAPLEASVVTLADTIERFGLSRGFDASEFVLAHFKVVSLVEASNFKEELLSRKLQTSEALKTFTKDHYRDLIHTARQVPEMEAEMGTLARCLAAYKGKLQQLTEMSFEEVISAAAATPSTVTSKANSVPASDDGLSDHEDLMLLEETAEELNSLVYERKFAEAVSLIETAFETMDELPKMMENVADTDRFRRFTMGTRTEEAAATTSASSASSSSTTRQQKEALVQIAHQISLRVNSLVETLKSDLQTMHMLKPNEQREIVTYMVRLRHAEEAREIFLDTRSEAIQHESRQIRMLGDLTGYIMQLATVYFRSIAATAADFRTLFTDPSLMSALVVWATDQVAAFAQAFRRHVFDSCDSLVPVGACLRVAFTACSQLLEKPDVGMRLSFMLARLLMPGLQHAIKLNFERTTAKLGVEMDHELWQTNVCWVKSSSKRSGTRTALKLTSSAKYLYDVIKRLMRELGPIINPSLMPGSREQLYSVVTKGTRNLIESFLWRMTNEAKEGGLNDRQHLAILANAYFLAEDLVPRLTHKLDHFFRGLDLSGMERYGDRLGELFEALSDSFCKLRAQQLVTEVLLWDKACETVYHTDMDLDAAKDSTLPVSQGFLDMLTYLGRLKQAIATALNPESVRMLLSRCVLEIFSHLHKDDSLWRGVSFTKGGLQQLRLDVEFLMAASQGYATDSCLDVAKKLVHRAVVSHSLEASRVDSNGQYPAGVFMRSSWFEDCARKQLQQVTTLAEVSTPKATST